MWQPKSFDGEPGSSGTYRAGNGLNRSSLPTGKLEPSQYSVESLSTKDHNGDDVVVVYPIKTYEQLRRKELPPFPYQVYFTRRAKEAIENPTSFAKRFLSSFELVGGLPGSNSERHDELCVNFNYFNFNCGRCHSRDDLVCPRYRFEIYTKPFTNVLACITHQRREMQFRGGSRAVWPHLLNNWTACGRAGGYTGRVIVIDSDDWTGKGVLLTRFDPGPHQNAAFTELNLSETERARFKDILRIRLRECWLDAGHEWAERDLQRRNDGGFSPALYPAVDPAAHQDAEDDHSSPLLNQQAAYPTNLESAAGSATEEARNELFKRVQDLGHLTSKCYSDCFGLPVTSVWDPAKSLHRPKFSMTLYLDFELPRIEPKALFSCLNKGLISDEAWTLDVIRNMPNLAGALDYHCSSTKRRRGNPQLRIECMRMLLGRVARNRLPVEIFDHVIEELVPPEMPNYSHGPTRWHKDVFLYLEPESLTAGPLTVYSDPDAYWLHSQPSDGVYPDSSHWFNTCSFGVSWQAPSIQVIKPRGWTLTSDEIHVLWSYCAPRAVSVQHIPVATIHMTLPDKLSWSDLLGELSGIKLQLKSSEPITVHSHAVLSHYWYEVFRLVDSNTGEILPPFPHEPHNDFTLSEESWSRQTDSEWDIKYPQLETIWLRSANTSNEHPLDRVDRSTWQPPTPALLQVGKQYTLKLCEDVHIPRWRYGNSEQPRGPHNPPPIPVVISEESQLTFRYTGF